MVALCEQCQRATVKTCRECHDIGQQRMLRSVWVASLIIRAIRGAVMIATLIESRAINRNSTVLACSTPPETFVAQFSGNSATTDKLVSVLRELITEVLNLRETIAFYETNFLD